MDKLPQSFKTFEDLEAYQIARQFRKTMYGVAKRLPKFEMFDLGSQIRRAAISLSNNIAEGHGRYHFPDQLRFVLQARGSLEELIDDLNICLDEEYLLAKEVDALKQQAWRTHHVINGYARYLRGRAASKSIGLHEEDISYEVEVSNNAKSPS